MKKFLTITFAFLLCAAPFAVAQHGNPNGPAPIHNGRWWEEKSGLYKEAFIGGYKAGSKYTAGHPVDVNKFQGSDLIDGLDHFYKDYRNHNIMIEDALHYTEEQLSGVPDEKLKDELLKMRAASAPTVVD
jgi:hypothetical protein